MNTALVIVDMQKYYLYPGCDFYAYHEALHPGSMDYIAGRCADTVIPNTRLLIDFFRSRLMPVIYLRLCGNREDRSDLHRFFRTAHSMAARAGYYNLYPTVSNPHSAIIDEIAPNDDEIVLVKRSFSPFTGTGIGDILQELSVHTLVFAGLATSQCVETTARDASDRGYSIIHIDDAQADYTEDTHYASLFSSQSVCGGWVFNTATFMDSYPTIMHSIETAEEILPVP